MFCTAPVSCHLERSPLKTIAPWNTAKVWSNCLSSKKNEKRRKNFQMLINDLQQRRRINEYSQDTTEHLWFQFYLLPLKSVTLPVCQVEISPLKLVAWLNTAKVWSNCLSSKKNEKRRKNFQVLINDCNKEDETMNTVKTQLNICGFNSTYCNSCQSQHQSATWRDHY